MMVGCGEGASMLWQPTFVLAIWLDPNKRVSQIIKYSNSHDRFYFPNGLPSLRPFILPSLQHNVVFMVSFATKKTPNNSKNILRVITKNAINCCFQRQKRKKAPKMFMYSLIMLWLDNVWCCALSLLLLLNFIIPTGHNRLITTTMKNPVNKNLRPVLTVISLCVWKMYNPLWSSPRWGIFHWDCCCCFFFSDGM